MKNTYLKEKIDRLVLPAVNKPGRYIGNELNIIFKDQDSITVNFAIAFPELYEIGMSSQAVGSLYHLLNGLDYVYAERVFAPWPDAEQKLREHDIPLYSLETFRPLSEFDVVGFTLQYELTYTNILNMLDLAGIPVWAAQRSQNDPIVMAGGPCSCNPEPLAPFIDVFYIGDAESGIAEVCRILNDAKSKGQNRANTLADLAGVRGVYVPALYQTRPLSNGNFEVVAAKEDNISQVVRTQIASELKNEFYSDKPIVPLIEVTHNRLPVEVMRGCTEGCRYCNAGMIYRPTRERSDDEIVDYSKRAIANTGFEEVSFLSLSVSDYSALTSLMRKETAALANQHVNISFPSMRLDSFSEEIAEFAAAVRKSGFTFAPEAGSMRLRNVINKNISDEDVMKAVEIALENGWKTLKFYFMIGLPTETKEDVTAIADLVMRTVKLSKRYGHIQFHVSISPFSPKSHTPFQWEKQDTKEDILAKSLMLKDRFKHVKQVKLSWRDPKVSEIECILGRGDRRLADVIYTAWKSGTKFDGWSEFFDYDVWIAAFDAHQIDRTNYLGSIGLEEPLPWDHIDKGVTKNYLKRERAHALDGKITIDCKDGTCFGCGIQRKSTFREFAECYQNLQMHDGIPSSDDKKREDVKEIPDPVNQPAVKYRIHFSKKEYARYLSHLDMLRVFERAFRRSKLDIAYSTGFNPRPKFSFGPALALGQSSDAEFFDVELHQELNENNRNELNCFLPQGLEICSVKKIIDGVPKLSKSINSFEYHIELRDHSITNKQINELLNSSSLTVHRTSKGQERVIDIRPYIRDITVKNNLLMITTNLVEGKTARIEEITNLIFGNKNRHTHHLPIHRKRQFIRDHSRSRTPMDF